MPGLVIMRLFAPRPLLVCVARLLVGFRGCVITARAIRRDAFDCDCCCFHSVLCCVVSCGGVQWSDGKSVASVRRRQARLGLRIDRTSVRRFWHDGPPLARPRVASPNRRPLRRADARKVLADRAGSQLCQRAGALWAGRRHWLFLVLVAQIDARLAIGIALREIPSKKQKQGKTGPDKKSGGWVHKLIGYLILRSLRKAATINALTFWPARRCLSKASRTSSGGRNVIGLGCGCGFIDAPKVIHRGITAQQLFLMESTGPAKNAASV